MLVYNKQFIIQYARYERKSNKLILFLLTNEVRSLEAFVFLSEFIWRSVRILYITVQQLLKTTVYCFSAVKPMPCLVNTLINTGIFSTFAPSLN
jgi:hypothetical protein